MDRSFAAISIRIATDGSKKMRPPFSKSTELVKPDRWTGCRNCPRKPRKLNRGKTAKTKAQQERATKKASAVAFLKTGSIRTHAPFCSSTKPSSERPALAKFNVWAER